MHSFFKNQNIIDKKSFNDNSLLRPKLYTVVVIYNDGYKVEYAAIEQPWRYIEKVKKNPKVKNAYIKDE